MSQPLLLKGGRVIDPASNRDEQADVLVRDGKIARIAPNLVAEDAQAIDVSGNIVVPGLIDLHTHCYWGGTLLGVNADKIGPRSGVTTWVDAGSSGAATFEGFYYHVIKPARMRILPFIHLSYIGLTQGGNLSMDVGELNDWRFADLGELRRIRDEFPGQIAGVKLRASNNACGENGPVLLPLARDAADIFDAPLMIHIGTAPPTLDEVLPYLHKGDILTHVYHPHPGGCVLDGKGRLKPGVSEAIERGVYMDVGHGGASFAFGTAEAAMAQGLMPDAISTDLHSHNIDGPAFDMPHIMSKFLALGMDFKEVLRLSTARPAEVLRCPDLGRLSEGGIADIAVFNLKAEKSRFYDLANEMRQGDTLFQHVLTVCDGEIVETFDDGRRESRKSSWQTKFRDDADKADEAV